VTPVAKQWGLYPKGTPQRALQDAVAVAYPGRVESFFEDVAKHLKIKRESASGAFYGFLRGDRSLPATHYELYIKLTGAAGATLDAIEAARVPVPPEERRDRLSVLEETVVRGEDLDRATRPLREAILALASGDTRAALRALSEGTGA
jgi:hypothetical protein